MGLRRHGWGTIQVDAKRQARIAEAEPVASGWHAKIQTFHVSPDDGELKRDVGGAAGDRERACVSDCDGVDSGPGILGRQRRIEGHVTPVEAVHDGCDIDADRQWPVGARRQRLRRCVRGQARSARLAATVATGRARRRRSALEILIDVARYSALQAAYRTPRPTRGRPGTSFSL